MTTKTDAIVRAIALLTARGDTDKAKEYLKWIGTPPKKTAEPKFVPPTIEEVRAYCAERNNGVDAAKFVNFYTSKGWKVGKEKMKDWRAAVRNWEGNNRAIAPKDDFGKYYGD